MSKEICISTTPHETRLAILEDDELAELYYERENEYTLAGSIYKGRVTRVLPGMQSAFVDIGLERDAFLYVTDFLEEQDDGVEYDSPGGDRQRRDGGRGRRPRTQQDQAATEAAPGTEATGAQNEESNADEVPAGTHRWRGRRGRGRGTRQRTGEQEGALASRGESGEGDTRPSEPAGEEPFYEDVESSEPAGAVPDALPGETRAPRTEHEPLPGEDLGGRRESRFGNRRGGFRDRRHGSRFEGRGGERHEDRESAFEHTGETPSESRILLPGESLSRYGGAPSPGVEKPESEAVVPSFTPNYTAPKPSTLIEAPITWDGGTLLPGESRSGKVGATPTPADQGSREVVEENAAFSATNADAEVRRHDSGAAPVATEPAATAEEPGELELHEEVREFEPEDASASHRVDAAPPSEFRISGATESEREAAEEAHAEADSTDSAAEDDETPDAPEHDEQATEVADQLFGFAPGAGVIEEEVIDEEEYDFDPAHTGEDDAVAHDSEELEEETLERAGQPDLEQTQEAAEDYELAEAGADEGDEAGEEAGEGIEEDSTGGDAAAADEAESSEPAARGRERRGRRGDRRGGRLGRRMGRGGHRPSVQTMDLPIISDLLKQGQEILLQIAKEPIARKGARVTSHIALPGRFLVFMPTVNHIGVSRKISSDEERMRLKRILTSEKGEAAGGFIVRTAADGASEEELRADLRFLISLWNDIKQREDSSKAPALIYHDLNLVERILRDQVSDNFSAIWVDSETEYERIVRFLNRFQPSLVRRVKLYTKETPLFEQFGIEDEITKALKSKVWLKSGGSIVINQTEALVAIDVNTGKYVGKTARLEDTIVKTNLDAIPEIVRQIRLRDLGGIIIIDFIDMDERRNRHKVLAALEEALKADRAPSKVLQFNDFGLVAITRKRVKQSLERTLSVPCPTCTGTGMVKSPTTVANEIYIELRKTQGHIDRGDIMLRVNPEVVKVLKANNARWLNELEEISGKTIIVKSDPALQPEQFDIH